MRARAGRLGAGSSLSTKPDVRIRRYEHGEAYVEIIPSVIGLAAVHDPEVLIYCFSQLIAAPNKGLPISRRRVVALMVA